MTQVHIDIRKPSITGVDEPMLVGMVWAPTAVRVVDDTLVIPESFSVTLNHADATVTVAPSQLPDWVWRVRYIANSENFDRYLLVPDSPTVVEFTDLVEVDPATLDPAAQPEAAWWVALSSVSSPTDEQVQDAVDAYLAANPVTPTTPEEIQDVVAAMVLAGANVSVTYDDTGGTLTISSSGGGGPSNAVQWMSLIPGDTTPLRIWKPSSVEPLDTDGVLDGDLWAKRTP